MLRDMFVVLYSYFDCNLLDAGGEPFVLRTQIEKYSWGSYIFMYYMKCLMILFLQMKIILFHLMMQSIMISPCTANPHITNAH